MVDAAGRKLPTFVADALSRNRFQDEEIIIISEDEDSSAKPRQYEPPRATRGRMIDEGLISDDDNSSTEPHQYEPPVRSQGEGATTAVGDEPMVTQAK